MSDLLNDHLQSRIPGATLSWQCPPQTPNLPLWLISEDYPREGLPYEVAQALMDDPPYWSFCWASGQVLARYLLDNPSLVAGNTVVDFGAGCGVVAIAAKLAGAERAIACDLDSIALAATRVNAEASGVELEYSEDI